MRINLAIVCSIVLLASCRGTSSGDRLSEIGPKPEPVVPPRPERIEESIRDGVDFLIQRQNENGSWGSPRRTKGLNIYAPVPGAHHAFRAATTALCLSAMIEANDDRATAVTAIRQAEDWLLEKLPKLRRATPRALYNVWGHAYGMRALVRMHHRHKGDPDKLKRIEQLLRMQVGMLKRYEMVSGGWGYYDGGAGTQSPSGRSNSFVDATVLIALHEADELGIDIPDKLVKRAIAEIDRQRKPDSSYLYAGSHWRGPMYSINRPGGSLGRSQVCNAALRLYGDKRITDDVLKTWLNRLFARNLWLDMGRKRPVPHESWFAVAGYFFYYGHFYAAHCIQLLDPADRPPFQAQLASILLKLQEDDGCWWDYPLYDYGQQYGTAYGIMTLVRCRKE